MEEIIATILWGFIEILFQILGNLGTWPSSSKSRAEPESCWLGAFVWACVGCLIGIVWAHIYPHFILPTPELRLSNLILGPILSGYVSFLVSRRRGIGNPNIRPRNHFWYSYWFTLGLIAARYGYTYHNILGAK